MKSESIINEELIVLPFLKHLKETEIKIQNLLKPFFESMKQVAEKLPESLKTLAIHGWYMSGDWPIYMAVELADDIKKGHFRKVDRKLILLYDKDSKSIIDGLKQNYADRNKMLDEAFKAHKKKMYFASTSLFLSIADGLCSGYLFSTKNSKKNLRKELTRSYCFEEFLAVLIDESAIDTPHHKKSNFPSTLNRHGVLHGLDFEYGTRINSLKALSLLAFVGDFFNKHRRTTPI